MIRTSHTLLTLGHGILTAISTLAHFASGAVAETPAKALKAETDTKAAPKKASDKKANSPAGKVEVPAIPRASNTEEEAKEAVPDTVRAEGWVPVRARSRLRIEGVLASQGGGASGQEAEAAATHGWAERGQGNSVPLSDHESR